MDIRYFGNTTEDSTLLAAAQQSGGEAVRIRVQPQILVGKRYKAWRLVTWTLKAHTLEEARAVRTILTLLFQRIARQGPLSVQAELISAEATMATPVDTPAPTMLESAVV